jgi:hypothetical protein
MGLMWSYVIFVLAAVTLSSILALLLALDEKATLAPDSAYYLELARGARVPRPFCFRPIVPKLLGVDLQTWKLNTLAAVVAQGVAIALLTGDLRSILLLLALPGGARFSLRHPVLVDAQAMVATLGVAIAAGQLHWSVLVVAGAVLACFRESAPIWLCVYSATLWPLVLVPATLTALYLINGRPTDITIDNSFIRTPLVSCLMHRHGRMFDWKLMLLPWGVLLPLALMGDWQIASAIWVLSCIPLIIVTDTARVQYWAAPALIPLALHAPIPEFLWPVLLAAHLFNPYRGA